MNFIFHSNYAFANISYNQDKLNKLGKRFLYIGRNNDTIKIKADQVNDYIGKLVKVDFHIGQRIDKSNKYILSYIQLSGESNKLSFDVILFGTAYQEFKQYPARIITVTGRLKKKNGIVIIEVKKKENIEKWHSVE